jgi:hypothetical protein
MWSRQGQARGHDMTGGLCLVACLSSVQILAALAAGHARRWLPSRLGDRAQSRGGDVGSLAHKVKTATSTFKPDNEDPPTLHTQLIADHMGSARHAAAASLAIMSHLCFLPSQE